MNNLVVLNNMKAVQETVEQLVVNTEVFASQRKCAVAMVDIANKYNAMVLEGKVNYTVEVAANGMDSENQWVRLVTEGLFDGAEWALENILETFNINTKGLSVDVVVEEEVAVITVKNFALDRLRRNFEKQSGLFYDVALMERARQAEERAKSRAERKAAQEEAERQAKEEEELRVARMTEVERAMEAVVNGEVEREVALAGLNTEVVQNGTKKHSVGGMKRAAVRARIAFRKENGYRVSRLVVVNGEVVMTDKEVKTVKVRKKGKKQMKVVYVPGDKGYTAPKGYATPKAPQNRKNVKGLTITVEGFKTTVLIKDNKVVKGCTVVVRTNQKDVVARRIAKKVASLPVVEFMRNKVAVVNAKVKRNVLATNAKGNSARFTKLANKVAELKAVIRDNKEEINNAIEMLNVVNGEIKSTNSYVRNMNVALFVALAKRIERKATVIAEASRTIVELETTMTKITEARKATAKRVREFEKAVTADREAFKAQVRLAKEEEKVQKEVYEAEKQVYLLRLALQIEENIRKRAEETRERVELKMANSMNELQGETEGDKVLYAHELASGSASTSNNNIDEADFMNRFLAMYEEVKAGKYEQIKKKAKKNHRMKHIGDDVVMSASQGKGEDEMRKLLEEAVERKNEAYAKLLGMNFLNTKNPEVVANAINKVINQANGLTPMITIATKKEETEETKAVKIADTNVSLGLMMRGRNRFNRNLSKFSRALKQYPMGGSMFKYTEDDMLIDEFIVLKADSLSIDKYIKNIFYVDLEQGIFAVKDAQGDIVNLVNKELVENVDNLNQYMFLGASPSALREKFGFYGGVLAKTYDAKSGATRVINDIINERCDGLMDKAKEKYTAIEAAKFSTRHMQYDTSSISMGRLGKVAKVNGVFDTSLLEVKNGQIVERELEDNESDAGTFDGVIYMSSSAISEAFKCSPEVAMQLSLQARPGSLKVQVQVVEDDLFYGLIDLHASAGRVTEYGDGDKVTMVFDKNAQKANIDLNNLELEVLKVITKKPSNLSKGILEKAIVAALEEDFALSALAGKRKFTKYNKLCNKVSNEFSLAGAFDKLLGVLEGRELSVSDLTNSSAICANGAYPVPAAMVSETKNTISSISNDINKLSYGEGIVDYLTITTDMAMLFGIKGIINEGEAYIPSKSNEVKDKDGEVVEQRVICVKYPTMGMKEYYSAKLLTIKEIRRRINKAQMPEMFKVAFGSDAKEKFETIKTALIKTYERMSKALIVLPASMDVFNSCAGLDVDTDAMAVIHDEFMVDLLFGKEELIELGELKVQKEANNKASSNNDAVADDYWNRVTRRTRTVAKASAINSYTSNEFLNTTDLFFFGQAYVNATRGNTESIGSISNSNSKIIAVYIDLLLGKTESFEQFYKENFGLDVYKARPNAKKYEGLKRFTRGREDGKKVIFVDEDVIDAVIKEAREMDVTNIQDALALMADVNRIFRFYQEKTIDMAKTGGTIRVKFSCKTIVLYSLVKGEVVNIESNGGLNFEIRKEVPELKDIELSIIDEKDQRGEKFTMKQMLLVDTMGKIQEQTTERVNNRAHKLVSEYKILKFQFVEGRGAVSKFAQTNTFEAVNKDGEVITSTYNSMANALQDAHDFFAANRPNKTLGLYLFKKVYKMLAAQFVDNIDGLDSKEDEALINAYRDQFKSKLAWITNSCEYILSDIQNGNIGDDYVMRGMVMLAVGANFSPSSNIKEESTNKFALNVCDHYTKCYALASNKVTVNCHVIECDESLVGQTVELVNGMSADLKLVVKDKFKKEKVKVQVVKEQVELLHPDGRTEMKEEIKVKYTERIVAPKHNSNMASLLVNAETIDEVNNNGEVVVDAGGNARKTVNNEILADVLKGKYATAIITFDDERGQEVMYLTSTTGEVVELPMCEEDFTDMEKEVVYSIGSSFLAGEGKYGVVAMQLNKESK